ncbi:MAG: hypothetical protein ACI9K2_006654, partial [Myxococcota bacterium]
GLVVILALLGGLWADGAEVAGRRLGGRGSGQAHCAVNASLTGSGR